MINYILYYNILLYKGMWIFLKLSYFSLFLFKNEKKNKKKKPKTKFLKFFSFFIIT